MDSKNPSKQILDLAPRIMRFIRSEMRIEMRSEMTKSSKGQLSVPQFRVLVKIAKEPSTHKEVAEWMGVAAPTLTRMIDTLVDRKLVQRATNATDRRKTFLKATPLGRTYYERFREKVQDKIEMKLIKLTSAEHEKLNQGLLLLDRLFQD